MTDDTTPRRNGPAAIQDDLDVAREGGETLRRVIQKLKRLFGGRQRTPDDDQDLVELERETAEKIVDYLEYLEERVEDTPTVPSFLREELADVKQTVKQELHDQ